MKTNTALLAALIVGMGIFLMVGLLSGSKSQDKYTAALDVNDPIYRYLAQPNDAWIREFGLNDRSAILYNLSLARGAIKVVSERLAKLEGDPNDNDPNSVGK